MKLTVATILAILTFALFDATPINDLGSGSYQGFQGGLYPGGANDPPQTHLNVGLKRAAMIARRDSNGLPSSSGKIVIASIGMSNTAAESEAWRKLTDPLKAGYVYIITCAGPGMDAEEIKNPSSTYWQQVDMALLGYGATPKQVSCVWLQEAIRADTHVLPPFPNDAIWLRDDLVLIINNLAAHFPNLQQVYVASLTYCGYSVVTLASEPEAYNGGFGFKWLIEKQIVGDPGTNADPAAGSVVWPWLAWGPYLWADGAHPRTDGMTWLTTDVNSDGVHPSPAGGQPKVANALKTFFDSSLTTRWFLK